MIRVNVGLSRKLSKDYNSTGYSINLEGEVTAPTSDPEAVVEQVKELYDLAEEALNQEIDRVQGEYAIGSRDEAPPHTRSNGTHRTSGPARQPGNSNGHQAEDPATNKQIQYLLNIGKRQRLSTIQLEARIEELLGQAVGIYSLTKKEAARAIDALTSNTENRRSFSR